MSGFVFSRYHQPHDSRAPFERLLEIMVELLTYTSGDVDEAIEWMRALDEEHGLTTPDYTIDDFLEDLKRKEFIAHGSGGLEMSAKMEKSLRQTALEQIFGKLKRSDIGDHSSGFAGKGDEKQPEMRKYEYGDSLDKIALTESLRNVHTRRGIDNPVWTQDDMVVHESSQKVNTSTVLMIDLSHSMILYGEDRITPAKKVAMALAEFIQTRYPKDTLDIVAFGNDAWPVTLKDLPYLQVGPFHTNTVAGLQLAQEILRKRMNPNRQIFMITDGKPSCLKTGTSYYKNSYGLDRKIVNKTLNEAVKCRRSKINVTTFMVASDPYLMEFIDEFSEACQGKAFYSGLDNLGSFVLHDYKNNKRKRT